MEEHGWPPEEIIEGNDDYFTEAHDFEHEDMAREGRGHPGPERGRDQAPGTSWRDLMASLQRLAAPEFPHPDEMSPEQFADHMERYHLYGWDDPFRSSVHREDHGRYRPPVSHSHEGQHMGVDEPPTNDEGRGTSWRDLVASLWRLADYRQLPRLSDMTDDELADHLHQYHFRGRDFRALSPELRHGYHAINHASGSSLIPHSHEMELDDELRANPVDWDSVPPDTGGGMSWRDLVASLRRLAGLEFSDLPEMSDEEFSDHMRDYHGSDNPIYGGERPNFEPSHDADHDISDFPPDFGENYGADHTHAVSPDREARRAEMARQRDLIRADRRESHDPGPGASWRDLIASLRRISLGADYVDAR